MAVEDSDAVAVLDRYFRVISLLPSIRHVLVTDL
jgi:hypothetical protein